MCGEGLA
jgi:hypothetical protein